MKKNIILLFLLFIPITVFADNNVTLKCDKIDKINVNDELVCRLTASGDDSYEKISFEIVNTEGLKVIDVRSNYNDKWKVNKDNNLITFKANEPQNGLQEFGIILIKALNAGEQTLALDKIILENSNEEKQIEVKELVQTIKVISSDNTLKSIMVNDEEIANFNPDNTKYYLNISNDFKVNAIASNDFAKVSGNGDYKINSNDKNMIIPIKVISENDISKIYYLYVNYSNEVKGLDNINIKNDAKNSLIIGFNKTINEYNIEVSSNTKSLSIKPELTEGYTFIKGFGEQELNLLSGNNIALIKVKDINDNIYTYIINVVKPILNKSNNNYIESITIKDYKLDFSKRVKNYSLIIDSDTNKLDIKIVLENKDSKYTINGNENLKDGSIIKIEVVAPNEEKTTYKINIKVEEKDNKTIIIIGLIGAIILLTIYLNHDKFKSKKKKQPIIVPVKEIKKVETVKKQETIKKDNRTSSKKSSSTSVKKGKESSQKNTNTKKPITKTVKKASSSKNSKTTQTKAKVKSANNSTSTRNPKNNYTKKNNNTRKKKTTKKTSKKK